MICGSWRGGAAAAGGEGRARRGRRTADGSLWPCQLGGRDTVKAVVSRQAGSQQGATRTRRRMHDDGRDANSGTSQGQDNSVMPCLAARHTRPSAASAQDPPPAASDRRAPEQRAESRERERQRERPLGQGDSALEAVQVDCCCCCCCCRCRCFMPSSGCESKHNHHHQSRFFWPPSHMANPTTRP